MILKFRSARGQPFLVMTGWMKHTNFSTFVKDKWSFSGDMFESLSNFTLYVKDWNKFVYRFVGIRKK